MKDVVISLTRWTGPDVGHRVPVSQEKGQFQTFLKFNTNINNKGVTLCEMMHFKLSYVKINIIYSELLYLREKINFRITNTLHNSTHGTQIILKLATHLNNR